MTLNALNSSNLEQLALKGLSDVHVSVCWCETVFRFSFKKRLRLH